MKPLKAGKNAIYHHHNIIITISQTIYTEDTLTSGKPYHAYARLTSPHLFMFHKFLLLTWFLQRRLSASSSCRFPWTVAAHGPRITAVASYSLTVGQTFIIVIFIIIIIISSSSLLLLLLLLSESPYPMSILRRFKKFDDDTRNFKVLWVLW